MSDGKLRILIVDDEPDLLTVLKFGLEADGFDVIQASDGEQGLAPLGGERPASGARARSRRGAHEAVRHAVSPRAHPRPHRAVGEPQGRLILAGPAFRGCTRTPARNKVFLPGDRAARPE